MFPGQMAAERGAPAVGLADPPAPGVDGKPAPDVVPVDPVAALGVAGERGPRPSAWRAWLALALVLGGALALSAFHLGSLSLFETSEARYASIARAMADGGSWWIPQRNGMPHLAKPPVTYWIGAAGIRLERAWRSWRGEPAAEPSEWGVKSGLPLAAMVTAAGCFVIGVWWANVTTGLLSSLVLITSMMFLALFKGFTTDPFLAAGETWMVIALLRAIERRSRWMEVAFFLLAGVVMATKGPPGLLPLLGIVPWLCWQGHRAALAGMVRNPAGWVAFILVGLGWYLSIAVMIPGSLGYFLWDESVVRYASETHGRPGPWYYFIGVMLAGMFPWSVLFLLAIEKTIIRRNVFRPAANGILLVWFVVPFVVFSLSGSKLAPYVLPLLVPAALMTGGFLARALFDRREVLPYQNAAILTMIVIALLGFGLLWKGWQATGDAAEWSRLAMVVGTHLLFMALFGQIFVQYGVGRGLVLVLALVAPGLISILLPGANRLEARFPGYRSLLRATAARLALEPEVPLVCVGRYLEGLRFYTGRDCITLDVTDFPARFATDPTRLLVGDAGMARVASLAPVVALLLRDKDIERMCVGLGRELVRMEAFRGWGLYRPGDPVDAARLELWRAKLASAARLSVEPGDVDRLPATVASSGSAAGHEISAIASGGQPLASASDAVGLVDPEAGADRGTARETASDVAQVPPASGSPLVGPDAVLASSSVASLPGLAAPGSDRAPASTGSGTRTSGAGRPPIENSGRASGGVRSGSASGRGSGSARPVARPPVRGGPR